MAGRLMLRKRVIDVAAKMASVRSQTMAHHKRKRPKNRRAGCLHCKPWKVNGFANSRVDADPFSDHRRRHYTGRELQEIRNAPSVCGI